MTNFFNAIGDFFSQLFAFIHNIVGSMLNALAFVLYLPSFTAVLIGFVPAVLGASITAVLAVGVVKLVLGWGNSQ